MIHIVFSDDETPPYMEIAEKSGINVRSILNFNVHKFMRSAWPSDLLLDAERLMTEASEKIDDVIIVLTTSNIFDLVARLWIVEEKISPETVTFWYMGPSTDGEWSSWNLDREGRGSQPDLEQEWKLDLTICRKIIDARRGSK